MPKRDCVLLNGQHFSLKCHLLDVRDAEVDFIPINFQSTPRLPSFENFSSNENPLEHGYGHHKPNHQI